LGCQESSLRKKLNQTFSKLTGLPNVNVKDGEWYDWIPGNYGKVTFGYQSVITVHAGNYGVEHLDIKTSVTWNFANISSDCTSGTAVFISTPRGVDVGEDFQMAGVWFGSETTNCNGGYQVLWATLGDFSIRKSQYPFYGVILSEQKITLGEGNVWHGCFAGHNAVHIKTFTNLLTFGGNGGGCSCGNNDCPTQAPTQDSK